MRLPAFIAALLIASRAAAQEPPPPPRPPPVIPGDESGADGLRTDLDRILSSEEGSGWFLDSAHYDAMHPAVLQSVCRTTVPGRALLLNRLESEEGAAGDPRAVFEAEGQRMTSKVEHALRVQRMRTALERAMHADCPFWVAPKSGFEGRQTDRNKLTLNAETGGIFQLRFAQGSNVTIGGGPSLRFLVGYGFDHVSVLAGVEISGGPMLREDDSSKLVLNYFPTIPIVIRIRDVNWIYSIEAGPASVFSGDNTHVSYGFRAGAGLGLMALRTRYFIPWAGINAYYEHYFEGSGRPAAELLRGGLRIGIIYDP